MWQRQATSTSFDGPGAPVDLRTISGLPGKILFAENDRTRQMTDLSCTVLKVTPTQLIVEPEPAATLPKTGTAVILEVAQQSAMVQCFTTVRAVGPGHRLTLQTPGRPHVLQRRRYPRVDLFLGITVSTPDRPIDQLPAQMINLSCEGSACVLAEPIAPGTSLSLNLTAIGLHPPETIAQVIRCTPTPSQLWVVGVRFQALAPDQEIYLCKYIADVTRLQSI